MAPEPAPPAAAAPSSPARRLRSRLQSRRHRLARDCCYLLPGLPIAAVGFAVLVSLTIASVATLVVWVGALLLPLTLLLGSRFADLSRARLRAWGMAPAPVQYLPRGGGLLGLVRRSEEHTSELQSRGHLVCRLLLEKKKEIWCR